MKTQPRPVYLDCSFAEMVLCLSGAPAARRPRGGGVQGCQKHTSPVHSQVPWCGSFLKYEDTNPWPTLFLASKKDRQIPWSYVDSVMKEQERRGRKTKLFLFPSSGHVAHLKVHPELYKQEVSAFLQSIHCECES